MAILYLPYPAWCGRMRSSSRSVAGGLQRQGIGDFLSLCREHMERVNNRFLEQKTGFIKGYMKCDMCVVIAFRISWQSPEYQFVLHRVPRKISKETRPSERHSIYVYDATRDTREKKKPDCVFPVRYMGHFPDKVITSGVAVASAIWLERAQYRPKVWGDFGAIRNCPSGSLCGPEAVIKIGGRIRPREIDGSLRSSSAADGADSCNNGLVKAILNKTERLHELPSDDRRNVAWESQLMKLINGVRVSVDTRSCLVEIPRGFLGEFLDCFVCPAESFIRSKESIISQRL